MNNLSLIIHSIRPMSQSSLQKIIALSEPISLKKEESISTVGRSNNFEYFLLEGICQSFLYNMEGEKVTLSFYQYSSVLPPSSTRNQKGKAILNLEAVTDVELIAINATAFEQLMVEDLEVRELGNTVLRNELMTKVEKEIALTTLKAIDRLTFLRKHYPNIENLVPHANIASYLGITTVSLSSFRTKS